MEVRAVGRFGVSSVAFLALEILLILIWNRGTGAAEHEHSPYKHDHQAEDKDTYLSHSCIHDEILHQRLRPGSKEYSITPQVYEESDSSPSVHHGGRTLFGFFVPMSVQKDIRQPIRIYLNYDVVGHSPDRDCCSIGDIMKLGEHPASAVPETPVCNPHGDPPMCGDCWYNCKFEDIAGEDKKQRLHNALGQTTDWFGRAIAVEPVKGNLQLSGYSACGQDGGVQLSHEYVEDAVANADLVLLVTMRPTTGNTLAWVVAC